MSPQRKNTAHAKATADALALVMTERSRAHAKWGLQRNDFPTWVVIAAEELGELSQAVLRYREAAFYLPNPENAPRDEISDKAQQLVKRMREAREEAAQLAAVMIATIEHLDETIAELEPLIREREGLAIAEEALRA